MIAQLPDWSSTIAAMCLATVIATYTGYQFLTRLRHYDKTLALLCCVPGGQAEVIVLSRELVEKDYVVALCHLVRVATVFCLVPLTLALVQGQEAVNISNENLAALPRIIDTSPALAFQFFMIALLGYYGGKRIRLPMPHLLGPLLFSALLHVVGLSDLPRFNEFILLAQVVIGGAVGARLAKVPVRKISGYLIDGIVNACLVITVYCLIASGLAFWLNMSFLNMMLAFIPGGLHEVTLIALVFGFDVVFVTLHHTVRILLLFFSLPWMISAIRK